MARIGGNDVASKRITTKQVQDAENKPFTLPTAPVKPEVDEDPWGEDGLTLKQRRFCELYVSEAAGNATKAAQLAGYRDDNRHALEATASENLRKPALKAYIGRLLARQGMTPQFLKSRLAELASASLNNFTTTDERGEVMVDLKQAAALGAMGQVKELKEKVLKASDKTMVIERTIKLHDPTPAVRTLLEMLGELVQRHEHTIGHKGYVGVSPDDWNARTTANDN